MYDFAMIGSQSPLQWVARTAGRFGRAVAGDADFAAPGHRLVVLYPKFTRLVISAAAFVFLLNAL